MRAMVTHDSRTTRQWHKQFASTARCVSLVRTQVKETLRVWGCSPEDADVVVLVASELATNAVVHGHYPGHLLEVGLAAYGDTCLIEVSDASPRRPRALEAGTDDETGRGLQLVGALAAHVGQQPREPVGKTVWATLHMANGRVPPASPVENVDGRTP